MKNRDLKRAQKGMTLIEILVAMALGTFLLAGVMQIFLSSKQSYRMQENMSRLQENGRFAMEFISRDIRMAGYFGCAGSTVSIENELKDQFNTGWDISAPLMGYNDIDGSFSEVSNVVVGTDVIVMRKLVGPGTPLISPFTNSAQMFVEPSFNDDCPLASATDCHEGEILMVTDCSQGTLFQATQTTVIGGGTGINLVHSANNTFTPGNAAPATFLNTYEQGSVIAKLNTYAYYIRLNSANQPSLYRSKLVLTGGKVNAFGTEDGAEEFVEGIENMQILYGVDTDVKPDGTLEGTPNYYVDAEAGDGAGGNVVDMSKVVSVRVTLTARTMDNHLTSTGDGRLRRTFSSTLVLRNRLQ